MPYKHIAAHLKKTELACRLHYHQLSHGSNRRKRTASVCSSGSMVSPDMGNRIPSPVREYSNPSPPPPMIYNQTYAQIQLPSASTLLPRSISNSPPRLSHQPILPKPMGPRRSISENTVQTPPLRLNCAFPNPASQQNVNPSINQSRLHSIYSNHRNSFWNAIALEYGDNISPATLEAAFLASASHGMAANSPPTPSLSPNTTSSSSSNRSNSYPVKDSFGPPLPTPVENKASATSISALLGIDASPRSPRERELIKRMEEGRDVIMGGVEMH